VKERRKSKGVSHDAQRRTPHTRPPLVGYTYRPHRAWIEYT